MAVIEFVLEVRESPSEVLRRLQNTTISEDRSPEDADRADAETSRFQVTALDGTQVEIEADAVSFVREA